MDPLSADFYDAFVRRVMAVIDAAPPDIALGEDGLARALGLSTLYFRRCLLRATGMSAAGVVRWRRAHPAPLCPADETDVYVSATLPAQRPGRRFTFTLFASHTS